MKYSLAAATDASAERSSAGTFFSTLFSISEHALSTSASNVSIFVNSVTGFGVFFFDFTFSPLSFLEIQPAHADCGARLERATRLVFGNASATNCCAKK